MEETKYREGDYVIYDCCIYNITRIIDTEAIAGATLDQRLNVNLDEIDPVPLQRIILNAIGGIEFEPNHWIYHRTNEIESRYVGKDGLQTFYHGYHETHKYLHELQQFLRRFGIYLHYDLNQQPFQPPQPTAATEPAIEIKLHKQQLEKAVVELINDFENKYGVCVKQIFSNNTPRWKDKKQLTNFLRIYYEEVE